MLIMQYKEGDGVVTDSVETMGLRASYNYNTTSQPTTVPFSMEGNVVINSPELNYTKGYIFSLGTYYNEKSGPDCQLLHPGIGYDRGDIRLVYHYRTSPSPYFLSPIYHIAAYTYDVQFHIAVEVVATGHIRVAIDGTFVFDNDNLPVQRTDICSPILHNNSLLGFGNVGLGDANGFNEGTGTVTNWKYYYNDLKWGGVNFTP